LAKIIRAHGKDGNLAAAIAVVESLERSQVPLTSLVHNSLIEACVQCGAMDEAKQRLENAKNSGLAGVVSFNTAMKGFLASGNTAEAHRLLAEMTERGLPASMITFHELLNAQVRAGGGRNLWQLVEKMKASQLQPNSVTCSILLKAVTGPAEGEHMARVIALIEAMDTPMDEVLFASVAEACIRTGRLDLLSRYRSKACKGGLHCLGAPTYGSMIKAYGQARDVEQVRALWEEMSAQQVRPTSITLGCMVEALVTNGCADEAWQLVQKLSEDADMQVLLNTVIYSTVLKGFAVCKRPDRMMSIYDEMRRRGVPCNTITYNTMLNAFALSGSMHRAPQLLEDMKNATPAVEPDIVTYSTLVKGFCAAGELDKGLELLRDMEAGGGLSADEVMYNSLLDGCARQHRLDDAMRILDAMSASSVKPSNYTLSIMVKLLGRARRLGQAFSMVKSLCDEHGLKPNVQVYTCLMQACFHNRQPMKALALHDEMVREGCALDQKAYVSLARGLLQAGAADRAAEVVRCAHRLPGHSLSEARGPAPGVDSRCLQEVLVRLSAEAAQELKKDLESARAPAAQRGARRGSDNAQAAPWRNSAAKGKSS
jgi:pentatricopeptide repeat protein